ncbi:hypothetical protein JCM3770_000488 [Rhodotorula araucariae]
MKAGAFGRPPERRQVQPGGRVLPGMFSSPSSSPAPSSTRTPSSRPISSSSTAPKLANPSGTLLSSWGTGGRGSGRLPSTTSSRLERLASDGAAGASRRGASGSDEPTRGGTASSISRARQLGLNRRVRTPSPPSSPEQSPGRPQSRSPSPPPIRQRRRAASQAAPSQFTRERQRQFSASPPRNRPRRASSPPPVTADDGEITPAPDTAEEPQGLLSSLWGRAAQLVGGSAAQQPTIVKEVGHNRASSVDSSLPAPKSKVTPFELHDSAASDEHELRAPGTPTEQSTVRNTRPIPLPPLVAPARATTAAGSTAFTRRVPASTLARAASEPLPSVEPITYHRPPPLHPRGPLVSPQRSPAATGDPPSPYDWLAPRDEAPFEPFLFLRPAGSMPTRRGGRAARKPGTPQGATTDLSVAGAATLAGGGAAALAASGLAPAAIVPAHPAVATSSSIPPLAPPAPALAYTPPAQLGSPNVHPGTPSAHLGAQPAHPGAPPVHPGPPPVQPGSSHAYPAVTTYQPAPPSSAYDPPPPLVAPAQPWSASGSMAPAAATTASPFAFGSGAASGVGAASGGLEAGAPVPVPASAAATEEPPAEAVPSYEPRPAAAEPVATEADTRQARPTSPPAQLVHAELPRSGTGPDSLPIYPSPSSRAASPASASSAPPPPLAGASYAQAPYEQAGYGAQTSQPAAAPPLVPPAPLPSVSQPYYPTGASAAHECATATTAPTATAPAAAAAPGAPSSAAAAHYAAHFEKTGPSLSTVAARILTSAATAALTPHAPHAGHPSVSSSPRPAPSATSATSAQGDLPPGPPILPITPPPVSTAPYTLPTTQSLYPAHLAAMQRPLLNGALAQTSWGALVAPLPPQPMAPAPAVPRIPSPAVPSPAPPSPAPASPAPPSPASPSPVPPTATRPSPAPSVSVVAAPALHLPDEAAGADGSPAYALQSTSPSSPPPSTGAADAPAVAPHLAAQTLPPSTPTPTSLPPPLPPASSPPPVIPPRPPALLISTTPSPSQAPRAPPAADAMHAADAAGRSSFVLTPPTPVEPHSLAQTAPMPLVGPSQEDGPRTCEGTERPAPAPVPAPTLALQPLELGFTLEDLGLGGLDFDLGLETSVQEKEERAERAEERGPLPRPGRASLPAVQIGPDDEKDEPANADPLDEAFDAATSFAASFAEADLARARVDPGHSARTERWLEQQGVQRKSFDELRPEQDRPVDGGTVAEQQDVDVTPQPSAPAFFRPRTAPPASVAPVLLTPRPYAPSSYHTRASSSSLPAPLPPPSAHPRAASLSYTPQLAFLATLRESAAPGRAAGDDGDDDEAEGSPPSPLETSIGLPEAALHRARAVAVDQSSRAAQVASARVTSAVGTVPLAADAAAPGRSRVEVWAQSATVARSKQLPRELEGEVKKVDKERMRAADDDEPLTGDKGETAEEVAAMFANW